jgi:hypothetical protein
MEVWKDIQGYEGLYQISNLGRVKSLPKKSPGTNTTKTSYLKHCFRCGYQYVSLSNNGKSQKQMIHRLLAIHFIENPDQKKCVNHKNGIRSDFRLENLEWCTHSDNSKHGYVSNKRKNAKRKLSENDVFLIKEELKNYKYGDGVRLAKKYNVSTFIISLIKVKKCYREENLG